MLQVRCAVFAVLMQIINRAVPFLALGLALFPFSHLAAQTPVLPLATPSAGALALGEDFSVGLRYDGISRSWGVNNVGQLGTAAAVTVVQPVPTQLRTSSSALMTGVARVYAGRQHGLLITTAATGVLRAWGRNDSGQLGDNSTTNRTWSVAVLTTTGLTNVVAADAGYAHSIALKSDGTVWAWGNNASGQVGDNSTTNRLTPVRVTPAAPVYPSTFKAVAAGTNHSLALRNDGTVWAWGANIDGQLGTGNTTSSLVPVQVVGLPPSLTVSAITAGQGFSAVLLSDGTVRVWGRADQGQLGNDDDADSLTPIEPIGLGDNVISLTAGDNHILALKSDGTVWGWGSNFSGELGGLVPAAQFLPSPISGLSNVAIIAAGTARSAAVLNDGAILIWGSPANAALGPTSLGYNSTRVQIRDVKSGASIFAGGEQAALVRLNNRAYLFGSNNDAQLGADTIDPVVAPTRFSGWPATVYAFGSSHTLGLGNGNIYAAGNNAYGQLGDGTTVNRTTPVTLSISGAPVTKIAAGWYHSLALRSDGTVLAWGRNDSAQLGFGSASASPTLVPTVVPGLTNVIALAAGEAHSLALKGDGTVWAWGSNIHGQTVGTGTVPILVPTQVSGPAYIMAIAAGANHSLALTSAGHPTTASRNRVYAWGRGTYGQIGNNATTARVTTPAFLATTGIVGIAAGENHSVARKSDGTVLAWGRNHRGQVGNAYVATIDADTTAKVLVPTAVTNIPAAAASSGIAAGFNTSYALYGNGTLFGWGDAARNQLGYAPSRLTPIAWRLTNNSADADADGMLDAWETARFGVTTKTGYEDTDADGLMEIQEHYYGYLPANYPSGTVGADSDGDLLNDFADSDRVFPCDGNSYALSVVSGGGQYGPPSTVAANPVVINVGAPSVTVYLLVSDPSMKLASTDVGVPVGATTLTISANAGGQASFYFQHRSTSGGATIRVTAGMDSILVDSVAVANATEDTDGDGLPDQWEASYFGHLRNDGSGDANGDGLLDRDAWRFGLSPTGADPSLQPAELDAFGYDVRGWLNSVTPRGSTPAAITLDEEGNVKTAN
jgi:alpha-tubulin suppressor-like RCC1 family protein